MHYTIAQWILYSVMLLYGIVSIEAAAAHVEQKGYIDDIVVILQLHETDRKLLQLLVNWNDNLSPVTSYNVILTAINSTECVDPPCSLYGTQKPRGNESLIIPENPMTDIRPYECNYMFGCNYTIVVETSNAMVSGRKNLSIPHCVEEECSCQHEDSLPKIIIDAKVIENDTIIFNWSINIENIDNNPMLNMWSAVELSEIHLRIREVSNPTLAWGGKPIAIHDETFSIKNMSHQKSEGMLRGTIKVHLTQQVNSKTLLNLYANVIDQLDCSGPANYINLEVPDFEAVEETSDESTALKVAVIVLAILFAVAVFLIYYLRCRKRKRQFLSDEMLQLPEMEPNEHYVDKYIAELRPTNLDFFEVPNKHLVQHQFLGEGAFGRVYKAKAYFLGNKKVDVFVAVKVLKKDSSIEEVKELLKEIEMLKGVGTHPNIVCFVGCCTLRPPYALIMEYINRGDLLSYLRIVRNKAKKIVPKNANYNGGIYGSSSNTVPAKTVKYIELNVVSQYTDSETQDEQRQPMMSNAETTCTTIDEDDTFEYILDHKELHNFALQIANGMKFLENKQITHRDLAARNVLIDDYKVLKISDFGLSRHGIYTNTKTRKLPIRWLSIEAIMENVYSNKSDVWAYGVVLWEIGTLGATPYPGVSNSELLPYLNSGRRLTKPDICTEQVYKLMLKCWDDDPDERPDFVDIYKELNPKSAYVDINSLSDDYVLPPIKDTDNSTY